MERSYPYIYTLGICAQSRYNSWWMCCLLENYLVACTLTLIILVATCHDTWGVLVTENILLRYSNILLWILVFDFFLHHWWIDLCMIYTKLVIQLIIALPISVIWIATHIDNGDLLSMILEASLMLLYAIIKLVHLSIPCACWEVLVLSAKQVMEMSLK